MTWISLIWLVSALLLLALELTSINFDGLMLAACAGLVLSVLTALISVPPLLQVGLFVGLTLLGTAGVSRWGAHRNPAISGQHLQDDHARVIEAIPAGGSGRVRWHGQSWAAVSLDPEISLHRDEQVLVMGRDGTHLQVMPQSK